MADPVARAEGRIVQTQHGLGIVVANAFERAILARDRRFVAQQVTDLVVGSFVAPLNNEIQLLPDRRCPTSTFTSRLPINGCSRAR